MDKAKKLITTISTIGLSYEAYLTKQEILIKNVYKNNITEVQNLLIDYSDRLNINKLDPDGLTPLHICAIGNYQELLQVLLSFGANINQKDKHGYTSLHFACAFGYENIIKTLIRKNADLNLKSRYGESIYEVVKDKTILEYLKKVVKRNYSNTVGSSSPSNSMTLSRNTDKKDYDSDEGIATLESAQSSITQVDDGLYRKNEAIKMQLDQIEYKQEELKKVIVRLTTILQNSNK